MIALACARERDVRDAAAAGRWNADLKGHVSGCATCGEVAAVTLALTGPEARDAETGRPLLSSEIDPARLWARARQTRRLKAEAQISRIITVTQIGSGMIVLAVLMFIARHTISWPAVSADLRSADPTAAATTLLLLAALGLSRLVSKNS